MTSRIDSRGSAALSAEPVAPSPGLPLDPHSAEAFRALVEAVTDYAIFLLDADGCIVSWNPGAQRLKGYAAHEIIGQHFSRFYGQPDIDRGWPQQELETARRSGRFEDEGWRVRKDGSTFWANVVITCIRDERGRLRGFAKITRDLTERRAHEQRLKASEETFRLLVEGVKDHAIFLLDADGKVQGWNAGAERVQGYGAQDVLGRHVAMFYTAEDIAAGKPQADLAIARGGPFEEAGWRVRRAGERFWADVTINPLNDEAGALRGFIHVTRDRSEQRRVQQLETEGRRLNEFIAMLAHELRNPLAPIGNAVAILGKVSTTPQLQWVTQLIERQLSHLSRLVDDLLDVSRVASGKIRLRRQPVDLGVVVAAALESMRPTVQHHGHTLEVALPEEPLSVDGDPTRLTQVIVNLVTNAAKYTPRGGRVRVELAPRGGHAELRVIDNGIGMSKALLETAFHLFVQGERGLDRAEGGLGIGLTLVERLVALHGGSVSAASAGPGQGSTFTVKLPLRPQAGKV